MADGYNPFSAICRSKLRRRGSDLTLRGEPPRCLSTISWSKPPSDPRVSPKTRRHKTSDVFRYGSRKELTRAPRGLLVITVQVLGNYFRVSKNFVGTVLVLPLTAKLLPPFARLCTLARLPFFISYSIFFSPINDTLGKFWEAYNDGGLEGCQIL